MRLKTESETGEDAKNTGCPFFIRYIRLHYPPLPATGTSHWLNFDANLLTSCQVMFPTSHSRCSLPWWIHCSLACSVFSDLRKHRIAGSISFVPHGEKTLVEKGSPSSRTTKSSFIRRSANFGNVSPFFVGTTNIFSALTHLPLKLPHCTRKQRRGITGYSVHHKIRS